VLAATILLSYALARFIDLPGQAFSLQLPGIYLSVEINAQLAVAFLNTGLMATGADWILRDHPALRAQSTFEHWLLPALTALVIGLPLYQLPLGPIWWAGFVLGGSFIIIVLVAEYITVDPDDVRLPVAGAGLTALAFALYLTLAISLRFGGIRLFLLLPSLTLAGWLVSLRALHLRLHGQWAIIQATVIAVISMQFIAAFHYLPLTPVSFGLMVLAPAYTLTSLFANLASGESLRRAVVEPAVVLAVIIMTALWIR